MEAWLESRLGRGDRDGPVVMPPVSVVALAGLQVVGRGSLLQQRLIIHGEIRGGGAETEQ